MKVVPYPLEGRDDKLNYFRLVFKNSLTEESYQRNLKRNFEAMSIFRESFAQSSHLCLIAIYIITYLLQLKNGSMTNSLIFQLVLILSSLTINMICLYMSFKGKKSLGPQKWLLHFSYLATCISLIFNDYDFQSLALGKEPDFYLYSLPGLIGMSFFYAHGVISNYPLIFLSNLLIFVLFSIFRLCNNSDVAAPLLEIFLLLLILAFHFSSLYLTELKDRKTFTDYSACAYGETEKMINYAENEPTDHRMQDCIEELSNLLPLMQDNLKYPVERTLGVLRNLANDPRFLINAEQNIEAITKNLDEEDKMYIQQSWTTTQVLNVRRREKLKPKIQDSRSLEKVENLDVILTLKQIGINWNLDSFEMNSRTDKSPVVAVGRYVLKYYNLAETFMIPEEKIINFLTSLEKAYRPNPYHNAMHAADVLASGMYIISTSFILSSISDLEVLGFVIAHLAHDVGHPGFTNRFLVNFQDKLALQCNFYVDNDISVLESMHSAITFQMLCDPSRNILEALESDQFFLVRKWIIDLILATDMGKHFELLGIFRGKGYSSKNFELPDCKLDSIRIIIKAADIGHAAKATELHMKWSILISEEFFRQGDIEKESGKPVSMYCDRDTTIIPKSQIGFLKNIALPLYDTLAAFLVSSSFEMQCVEQIRNNIAAWELEIKHGTQNTMKDPHIKSMLSEYQASASLHGLKSTSDIMQNKSK